VKIDSHQHFWKYDAAEFAWISDPMATIRRDFLPADLEPLLMESGYSGCVAVQAPQTLEETRFLLDLSEENDWILGVVGWIDLLADNPFSPEFMGHPKLKGVRHIVQAEPYGFLFNTKFRDNVRRLPEFGLTYDLLIYHDQMDEAADFVWSLPDVPMVLDHLAKPPISEGRFKVWAGKLKKLSRNENMYIKLSGLAFEADWHSWDDDTLRPWIKHAVKCFGPERCMIGSDWPVSLCAGSYDRIMGSIERILGHLLTKQEMDAVLGGNAQKFYRL